MTRNSANRLAITSAIAAVLLLCAYATGTSRNGGCPSSAVEATAVTVNEATVTCPAAEAVAETDDVSVFEENDNKVRQAARDLIREKYPNSKVEGVFTLAFRVDNLYIAGADTTFSDGSRRTVDLLVRQYTKRTGGTYWRAESLGPDRAAEYVKRLSQDPDAAPIPTEDSEGDASAEQ